jgi:anti-sigma-K factor RskA
VIAGLAAALVALAAWNVQLNQTLSQGPTRYVLTGQGQLASAHGTTTVFEREGLTVASFSNLPEPTPGKVYQLWLIDDQGKAASAGVFTPDRDGAATLALDRSLNGVRTVAVTSEAGPNGAPAPTQTPQLAGTKTS